MTRVLFIGSKRMGLECLRKVHELSPSSLVGVLTLDDRSDKRSVYDEFCHFAEANRYPLLVATNRSESERMVREICPDICLVVGWYWLIGKASLESVPRGFLGIHNSLLPRYRGAAPVVWAMINGESTVGFSLFSFTEGMDDGAIWGQRSVRVEPDDYIAEVLKEIQVEAISLLDELWMPILEDRVKPSPQDHSKATFSALRSPEDGQIDWNCPAHDVYNFIRAQSKPYPGAFTYLPNHGQLKVWRARPVDACFYGTPGQVAQNREDGVYVICGDRRPLLIEQVGLDGDDEVPAAATLTSLKIRLSAFRAEESVEHCHFGSRRLESAA